MNITTSGKKIVIYDSEIYYELEMDTLIPDHAGSYDEKVTVLEALRDRSLMVIDDPDGNTHGLHGHVYYE